MSSTRVFRWTVLVAAAGWMWACGVGAVRAAEDPKTITAEAIRKWQGMRFGMFIHWGPVSLKGTEIGWSRGRQVPKGEYDQLYKKFNPVKFDADEWVGVAAEAGMKYMVITSKHHDGFCLWPSKYTDYHIGNSPFQRDVIKELSQACKKGGLQFSTYYSICDWHHGDYPLDSPGGRGKKATHNMPRYFQYVKNQTREILANYGPLGVMWFDGEWEKPWTRAYGKELYEVLKKTQPTLVINNRVAKGRHGMAGTTKQDAGHAGDYDTPEQRVGGFNRKRPWETCMTICRQWAWKPKDRMKSLQQCMQTLLRVVGGDGNLLFNVGPMPDGRIEPRQAERLKEMGQWLAKYGQGVYGTRGGPFMPGTWGAATAKGDKVYLFVMNWPREGPLRLPPIGMKITTAKALTGGAATVEQDAKGITVALPPAQRQEIATVIELTVSGRALDIPPAPVVVRSGSAAFGKKASASNVYRRSREYGPGKAFDDDPETRWATDTGTRTAWLAVDLGKLTRINRVTIDECVRFGPRVRKFELQYGDGGEWKVALGGMKIGRNYAMKLAPVTASHFRLNILDAADGPTIWELRLFKAPDS